MPGKESTPRESEGGQLAMLTSILNGMDALITVCDPETFEILFLNDSIRDFFGIEGDGVGELCYELLQNQEKPCEECPYLQLRQKPDQVRKWIHKESVKGSILSKTARFIDWPGGKTAHLEYATDITEARMAREALESREKMLGALVQAALVLFSQNEDNFLDTMTAGVNIIADIMGIDRMSVSRYDENTDGLYASQIYLWNREKDSANTIPGFINNPYIKQNPRWRDILSSGECVNGPVSLMPEARAIKQFGCLSVLAVPVFVGGAFWGFVLFEDLKEEREFTNNEADILRMAGIMFANTVMHNETAAKIRLADKQLKRMMQEIEYQNHLLHTVNRISAILLQAEGKAFERDLLRSMGIMAEAARADRVYIWENYLKEGERFCRQTYEWSEGAPPLQGSDIVSAVSYRDTAPNWERAFLHGECINGIVSKMHTVEKDFLNSQGIRSLLVVPIYLKEQFWGFVGFDDCHKERVFSFKEEQILRSASELIANALIRNSMEKSILYLESEADKIYYDPLTGIYNRRFFDSTGNQLIRTLSRSGGNLSVMMIDIDFFKPYNDAYGHVRGDACLKAVAETLKGALTRSDDFVARYGGEEFVAVLPNTDEAGARMMAQRLLNAVRSCEIPHKSSDAASCVTISIGVTTGKAGHTQSANDYVRRADAMLYESKHSGRNKYTFARMLDS
ncbi:MAG: diguanylate cyclase [Oscillospiraceae bacterium]|nr:diguanylate cyclase [Oscillospiraceae bacterium]